MCHPLIHSSTHHTPRENSEKGQTYIVGVVFDAKRIVLVPHGTVVDPDVIAGHVKTIGVEGRQINDGVGIVGNAPGL